MSNPPIIAIPTWLWYYPGMSKQRNNDKREYTEAEQSSGLVGRRLQAFAERSREPGNAVTWAIVLGALICTLLVISYSVAGQPVAALGSAAVSMIWMAVVTKYGQVNIASILWGSDVSDFSSPPVESAIFQTTTVLTLIALGGIIVSAFTGFGFGWYGVAMLVAVVTYLVIYIRAWILPGR